MGLPWRWALGHQTAYLEDLSTVSTTPMVSPASGHPATLPLHWHFFIHLSPFKLQMNTQNQLFIKSEISGIALGKIMRLQILVPFIFFFHVCSSASSYSVISHCQKKRHPCWRLKSLIDLRWYTGSAGSDKKFFLNFHMVITVYCIICYSKSWSLIVCS